MTAFKQVSIVLKSEQHYRTVPLENPAINSKGRFVFLQKTRFKARRKRWFAGISQTGF